jgi:hypothetical protein
MIVSHAFIKIPSLLSLGIIVGVMVIAIIASMRKKDDVSA